MKVCKERDGDARSQWLMPVILATRDRNQEDHSLKPP
jgi:hypothetical protein